MTITVTAPGDAAGGPTHVGVPEADLIQVGATHSLQYRPGAPAPRVAVYKVALAPARLTAVIESTELGFVATCPELETLGYGDAQYAALEDLVEATREYLAILAEDDRPLSPRIAHHAMYIPLLRVPDASWFAAVTPSRGQDAT